MLLAADDWRQLAAGCEIRMLAPYPEIVCPDIVCVRLHVPWSSVVPDAH